MNIKLPVFRVYQHVSMNGLFLFNDALVITRRMSKHFPFSRAIEYTYKFEVSVALGRMRVHDIPESKCKFMSIFVRKPIPSFQVRVMDTRLENLSPISNEGCSRINVGIVL